jgi:hypothetical protein
MMECLLDNKMMVKMKTNQGCKPRQIEVNKEKFEAL